jgi:DNA invertase Pin-like site-specific DNA recombinase
MLIGYARVFTDDQSSALRLAALKRAMRKTIMQIRCDPIGNHGRNRYCIA